MEAGSLPCSQELTTVPYHETGAITNIFVLVSTHAVPKNTNISNKFTLYHPASCQKKLLGIPVNRRHKLKI